MCQGGNVNKVLWKYRGEKNHLSWDGVWQGKKLERTSKTKWDMHWALLGDRLLGEKRVGNMDKGTKRSAGDFSWLSAWFAVILPSLDITSIHRYLIPGTISSLQGWYVTWSKSHPLNWLLYILNCDTEPMAGKWVKLWQHPIGEVPQSVPDLYSSWVPVLHLFHGSPKYTSASPIQPLFCSC